MTGTTLGIIVSGVGYTLAICGGWKLFQNTAPDRPFGMIPRTNNIHAFQQQQEEEVEQRRLGNRRGFALLTVGALLQLVGTLLSGFLDLG